MEFLQRFITVLDIKVYGIRSNKSIGLFLSLFISIHVFAQTNVFSPVTAFNLGTQSCNGTGTPTNIIISTNNAAFGVGNKVLIIQMKGASVNTTTVEPPTAAVDATFGSITAYNEAGNYEFAIVATNSGGSPATLTFTQPLVNVYNPARGPVQLVSVPQYTNLTISTPLIGTKWNGTIGGVLTFEVGGTLTLNSTISMDSAGFKGGKVINLSGATPCNSGFYTQTAAPSAPNQSTSYRGEGIGINADAFGRGAWANGGGAGSGHNGGGAGGGNYCAGGIGGYEYSACYSYTGPVFPFYATVPNYVAGFGGGLSDRQALGGYPVAPSQTKVFMGGGGGGGDEDDGAGTPGGNGGGIIIISADEITGTNGIISANGQAGWRNGLAPYPGTSDGVGGGGAGGSILLNVSKYTITNLSVQANGGKGGDNYQASTCHGSGGGGGAGYVALSIATPANVNITANGGTNGQTRPDANSSTDQNCYKSNYGAKPGGSCSVTNNTLVVNTINCPCSAADLGPDQSLCGNPSIVLTNGTASNTVFGGASKVFTWYLNGTVIAGATGPTYTATAAGLYKVSVDSLGCIKTAQVTIINTLPIPYLGPNRAICSPSYYDLTTPNAASFPSGTTYQWTLNGTAITGATSSSLLSVTAPGTYVLTASIAGCPSTSASVTLSSTTPVAVNGCLNVAGKVSLSITNATGGPYNWYTAPTGGTLVQSNSTTFTTPVISTTTTYYVEDDGLYNTTVGPPAVGNGFTGQGQAGNTAPLLTLYFNALKAFNLNGLTVIAYTNSCSCGTTFPIALDVKTSGGVLVGTGTATGSCCPSGVTGSFFTMPITFTTPIAIPAGTNYSISVNAATTKTIAIFTGGTTFSENYSPVLSITGNGDNNNPNGSPAYFDWQISYAQGCNRIPVIATISSSCTTTSPVKLINFTAEMISGNAVLNWSTAIELNNSGFTIQRSADGIHFEDIGKVLGNGNSSTVKSYQFTDQATPSGNVYYRLMQVDYNGDQQPSNIIVVANQQPLSVMLFPNPFTNVATLVLNAQDAIYKVEIRITDLSGKVLYYSDRYTTNQTINLGQDLAKGMYILEVLSASNSKILKIIKE